MSGLVKEDWKLPLGMMLHRKIGKKVTDPGDGGQQKGAPGFTTFRKPSQGVKSPLGG